MNNMGACTYCGLSAGFLRSKHKECEEKYQTGKAKITESICNAIAASTDYSVLETEVKSSLTNYFIKQDEVNSLYAKGFDQAVNHFLKDGLIAREDEVKLNDFEKHFQFDQAVLNKSGALEKIMKSSILKDVMDGKTPEAKLNINGNLPFLFQKSEYLIWVFQNVEYYEQRTRTVYQGRSHGVSIKIAKGLYYRTGAFQGNPVKIEEMQNVGRGLVALTNKHLYFSGPKSFKVPYNKIVTLNSYSDGIGFQKDGANSKPQILRGLDSWFAYNLITNLNNM